MRLKALYMFVNPAADPANYKAVMELPTSTIYFLGVRSVEEGAEMARKYADDGVVLVELCGGFGYDGAQKVSDAVGDRASVGVVVHQVKNASKLAAALAGRI
jgi:hypothetical protein